MDLEKMDEFENLKKIIKHLLEIMANKNEEIGQLRERIKQLEAENVGNIYGKSNMEALVKILGGD